MKFTRSSYDVIACLTLLTLVSVASMSGCNEKKHVTPPLIGPSAGSGPAGGGDTRRIQLLASPSEKQEVLETEQATVRITALLKNNIGQPMPDGTAVYWNSTIGTLDSVSTTSSNGSTGVTFTFPTRYSGCSQVTARSGDASASIRVCVTRVAVTPTPTIAITPTPAPTAVPIAVTLAMSAAPNPVPTGTTSTIITLSAFGSGGTLLTVPITVQLSSSSGIAVITPSAIVTFTGTTTVTVTYTGVTPTTITVYGTVTSTGYIGSGNVAITFN